MYRTVIKLNTLSNTDRAGTKYHDLLFILIHFDFGFPIVAGIIIRCLRLELSRTGIYDLVRCIDAIAITKLLDFFFLLACNLRNHLVRELHALCFLHHFLCDLRCFAQCLLFLYDIVNLIDKPDIYFRDIMNFLCRNSTAQCLCNNEDTTVIDTVQHLMDLLRWKSVIVLIDQTVHMLFKGTKCLHQRTFKVRTDTHDLTGRLHLCGQLPARHDELIKWKSWHLDYDIVQRRLKARICLACNCIPDLIEIVSKCDLRSYLRDRITGCLRSKCR